MGRQRSVQGFARILAPMSAILAAAFVLVFPALVILAGLKDAVSYTIPNWISVALVGAFPLAALGLGLSFSVMGLHLAIGGAGLVAAMIMFALGWIGGGDAKLFAAAALWLGWPACLPYLAVTGIAGGALASGLLALRSPLFRPFVVSAPSWLARLAEPGENVPYGLAIAAGALFAFPASPLAHALPGL